MNLELIQAGQLAHCSAMQTAQFNGEFESVVMDEHELRRRIKEAHKKMILGDWGLQVGRAKYGAPPLLRLSKLPPDYSAKHCHRRVSNAFNREAESIAKDFPQDVRNAYWRDPYVLLRGALGMMYAKFPSPYHGEHNRDRIYKAQVWLRFFRLYKLSFLTLGEVEDFVDGYLGDRSDWKDKSLHVDAGMCKTHPIDFCLPDGSVMIRGFADDGHPIGFHGRVNFKWAKVAIIKNGKVVLCDTAEELNANSVSIRKGTPTRLYRWFSQDGTLLYIGISKNLRQRVKAHDKASAWIGEASVMTVEHYPNRQAALLAERKAIRAESPLHNVVHNRCSA